MHRKKKKKKQPEPVHVVTSFDIFLYIFRLQKKKHNFFFSMKVHMKIGFVEI